MFTPSLLVIEITSRCNAKCPYCARTQYGMRNNDMDLKMYKTLLMDAMQCGIKRLRLYMWGEPTLHRDYIIYAAIAKEMGFHITTSTNGMVLSNQLEILNYIDMLRFSIDGYDAQFFEKCRYGLNFKKVKKQ